MPWFTEPLQCQRCSGALTAETETCRCGGHSQYWVAPGEPPARGLDPADALLQLLARKDPPS